MPVKSMMTPRLRSQLLGFSTDHLADLPNHNGVKVHRSVLEPLMALIDASQKAGFDLRVASGFRSFERQLLIWNSKCRGERLILDTQGSPLNIKSLSALEKVEAILRWSALPGASRHHWGTECDIYDAAAMPKNYQLQLHPDEYAEGGLFAPMMDWLSGYLQASASVGFYRPYLMDNGGVAPEPWHISYHPVSFRYEEQCSLSILQEHLQQLTGEHRIEEQDTLIENLESIYCRFIQLTHTFTDSLR